MAQKEPIPSKKKGFGDPRSIRVLMYHRIAIPESDRELNEYEVDHRAFRRHIQWLDRWGYTTVTFNDYRLFLEGELDLPKKPVIITFDDGYLETYDIAFPILRDYGMKAVLFVVGDVSYETSSWEDDPQNVRPLFSRNQLLEMHAAGFEIGSHTLTHVKGTEKDPRTFRNEVSRSRILLEIVINAPVLTFAYPYGSVNEERKAIVADAGYRFACGSYSGPAVFGDDHYEIRRVKVLDSRNVFVFWFQLQPLYLHYRWVRWKMKLAWEALSQSFQKDSLRKTRKARVEGEKSTGSIVQ